MMNPCSLIHVHRTTNSVGFMSLNTLTMVSAYSENLEICVMPNIHNYIPSMNLLFCGYKVIML